MIDKKGRLFSKISIVDIFIVLALLVMILGFYYKMSSGDERVNISSDSDIKVTFKIEGVRMYAVEAAVIGDTLYEQNGPYLGEIVDVYYNTHREIIELDNGQKVLGKTEGKYDLYITINGKGKISDSGYYLNGTRVIAMGSTVQIETSRISADSTVSNVTG